MQEENWLTFMFILQIKDQKWKVISRIVKAGHGCHTECYSVTNSWKKQNDWACQEKDDRKNTDKENVAGTCTESHTWKVARMINISWKTNHYLYKYLIYWCIVGGQ